MLSPAVEEHSLLFVAAYNCVTNSSQGLEVYSAEYTYGALQPTYSLLDLSLFV